jgi:hypothetical protein
MKPLNLIQRLIQNWLMKLAVMGVMALALPSVNRAAIVGPYPVDGYTLHLWHLDETNGTPVNAPTNGLAFDAVSNNPQTTPITMSLNPGKFNGAFGTPTDFPLQGQPAFAVPGFLTYGYSVETGQYAMLYGPYTNADPSLNASATPIGQTNLSDFINTNTGAFTFEALVNPLVLPINSPNSEELICGDSGFTVRAWQFRLRNTSGGAGSPGELEFNDINGTTSGTTNHDMIVPLPSSGPDAVVVGNWYHVAVTFTGAAPTNGDTPLQFKFYWTLMDPTRTNADLLIATNLLGNLHGNPFVGIGGNCRGSPLNNSGDGDALLGYIDECRVSSVCRKSTEMAFNTNPFVQQPVIGGLVSSQLVAYGQTLTLNATETGTTPITNQWFQNGAALPGQTNAVLVISNITFAANGNYQLFATNASGTGSSIACTVTVGAAFNGLFNTGVDANGNVLYPTAAGSVDLHYALISSADPATVGSNAIVWSGGAPISPGGGTYVPDDALSGWIGSEENAGGPVGSYTYQTQFQIDNGDVASAVISGYLACGGPATGSSLQSFVNGVETDILLSNPFQNKAFFVITNGFQAGSNVLTFIVNSSGNGDAGALHVEMTGIGNALPTGLPVITNEPPANETIAYGVTATVSAVALGRPPLSYQWLSNGTAINPATTPSAATPNLTFAATNFSASEVVGGNFDADYQLVVGNASGYVTSSVVDVTVQIPPLTVVSAGAPIWSQSNNVVVIFSHAVDPTTSTSAGNYSLNNGATILSASLVAPTEVVLTTSVLNPTGTYTLTVQNVEDVFDVPMSPTPSSLPVGIYPVATVLWVAAGSGVTTDANGVNQWNDMSGNGNNLYNSDGAPYEPQLVTNVLNGMPVIRFTATNETFLAANDSPTLEITGDMTIFAAINFATLAGNTNGMIVSKTTANLPAPYDYYANASTVTLLRGNGTAYKAVTSARVPSVGVPHLMDVMMQGTTVTHRLDGNTNGSGTLSTPIADTGQPLYIGTRGDTLNRLTGDLAELIVIGSALSSNDVASMENYLANKYDLAVGPESYPVITQQPVASTNVSQGSILTVAAAATGNPAVAYQWYDTNNVPVPGQTNATLVISNIQTSDSYYLNVTNAFGSVDSTVIAVNVVSGLNVNLGPASQTLYAGETTTYAVFALGTVPFYYQWLTNGVDVPGATSSSYALVVPLGSLTVSCTVSNAYNGGTVITAGPVSLTGIASPTNLYPAHVLGNNPIAYWRLDESPDNGAGNDGTVAYDYVGGHNGAYNNVILGLPGYNPSVDADTSAKFGIFAASNSYMGELNQTNAGLPPIDFSTPSGGNAELSVEAWVNVTNTSQISGAGIVTKGYGNGGEQFDLDVVSDFRFFVRDAAGGTHGLVSTIAPASNVWYHIVAVWDGANGAEYLYINGVTNAVATGISTGLGLFATTTTNTALPGETLVSIGARTSGEATNVYDLQFKGRIDDVAIYNYALSPVQVRADYEAGANNVAFSTNAPDIAYSVTGSNLTFTWPASNTGWRLLAETNGLTVGASNWFTIANSSLTNLVTVPLNKANHSVFYKLVYP